MNREGVGWDRRDRIAGIALDRTKERAAQAALKTLFEN